MKEEKQWHEMYRVRHERAKAEEEELTSYCSVKKKGKCKTLK